MTTTAAPTVSFAFGRRVVVNAETVRVIGKQTETGPAYRQSSAHRDVGRLVKHQFADADVWPGYAVSLAVAPARSATFDPSPELGGDVITRLRRVPLDNPEIGIVVGVTRRTEGVQRGADSDAHLAGPTRTVTLYEVALPPAASSKARITLVHEIDLEPIERRPR